MIWTIHTHVVSHQLQARTVSKVSRNTVAFSLAPQDDLWQAVYEAMGDLRHIRGVIVCAARNDTGVDRRMKTKEIGGYRPWNGYR